jgi:hypothetical protein
LSSVARRAKEDEVAGAEDFKYWCNPAHKYLACHFHFGKENPVLLISILLPLLYIRVVGGIQLLGGGCLDFSSATTLREPMISFFPDMHRMNHSG